MEENGAKACQGADKSGVEDVGQSRGAMVKIKKIWKFQLAFYGGRK